MNNIILSADNHNVASGSESFLEGAASTVKSYAVGAVVSGAHSFYNTAVDVGNFLGGNFQRADTLQTLQGLDASIGNYYLMNKDSVDLGGLIIGGIVPGIAATNAVNWGSRALVASRSGFFGHNIASTTGLVPTASEALYAKAAAQIAEGTFSSRMNRTAIAGLVAGIGEQAIMVAGTEALVASTMQANPIIENLTLKDHIVNTAAGAAFFSPIFAGIGAFKGFGQMKKAAITADQEAAPWRMIPEFDPKLDASENLIGIYKFKKSIPELPSVDSEIRAAQLSRYANEQSMKLDNMAREQFQKLTGGDVELTNTLMKFADSATSADQIEGAFAFLKEVRRGNVVMTSDKETLKAFEKTGKATSIYTTPSGKHFVDEVSALGATDLDGIGRVTSREYRGLNIVDSAKISKKLADDDTAMLAAGIHGVKDSTGEVRLLIDSTTLSGRATEAVAMNVTGGEFSKKFLHLRGELKGTISDSSPAVLRLGDYLKPGEKITTKGGVVQVGKLAYKQPKLGSAFDTASLPLPEVQARYVYAAESSPLKAGVSIHQSDIPFLEKAYHQGLTDFNIIDSVGNTYKAGSLDDILGLIAKEKNDAAIRIKGTISEEVAERINVPLSYLEGRTVSQNPAENLFAWQHELLTAERGIKPYTQPSYAQIGYKTASFDFIGNKLDNLVSMEQRATMARQYNDQVVANYFKESFYDLPNLTAGDIAQTSRYSGGQSFMSFGQGQYFTPEATADFIGRLTANATNKAVDAVTEALTPIALKLANNQAAAIETSVILNRARAISDSYVLMPGQKAVLKSKVLHDQKVQALTAAGKTEEAAALVYKPPVTKAGNPIEVEIQIQHKDAYDFLYTHSVENKTRLTHENNRRSAMGINQLKVMDGELYAPPHDFKKYPHFALVKDGVTGEMSFIGAYTAKDLEALAAQVPKEYKVLYKQNTEEFHKALGEYEFAKTFTESSVDTALKREGVLNAFFPKTDPIEIVTDVMNWHKEQAVNLTRGMIKLKYQEPIGMLESLSELHTAAQTSVARKSAKTLTETVDDPYEDMIKTMLNISKAGDYKTWTQTQQTLDSWVSRAFSTADRMKAAASGKSADELLEINDALAQSGYRGPLYNMETVIAANHSAPQGVLSEFVRKANALATGFMLRLDSIQALNNAIGTNILLSSETQYLISKIKQHPRAAEKLKELLETSVPGVEGVSLNTPAKLMARQYNKFFTDLNVDGSPIITRYQDLGLIKLPIQALRDNFDSMALRASETKDSIKRLDSVWQSVKGHGEKAMEKGELWTGNKHSEMMGRFVAAGVADDIGEIALQAGIITPTEKLVMMNSFVNKVHGSTLASQRPILFQGAVGQAISLFQTYQFNLMQQLFKYIGNGQTKSAWTLMGMQTAIYGVQGIPAFNALNTHIIGNAKGNVEHRDVYSETYNTFGKDLGDWLLYGTASNILGVNLYSRGDLNPRQATIVPVLPQDVPFVALSAKAVGNLYNTISKTAAGAPASTTFLQGLEHAGINRPLSGFAAFVQGYTTTSQGSLLTTTRAADISNVSDLNLVANMGRMLGAKPMDEAIILDANYRYAAYRAKEMDSMKFLGSVVKTKMLSGQEISELEMVSFMNKYQAAGGKQETFNKQMLSWQKDTTESTVNQVASNLNTGAGRYLQRIMAGGTALPDFTTQGE